MAPDNTALQTASSELHAVPVTLEGLSVLHQMFRFRWAQWRNLGPTRQREVAAEAAAVCRRPKMPGKLRFTRYWATRATSWSCTSAIPLTN